MLTIKTLERIKRGAKISLISGVYAIILGILYLSFIKFIVRMNFRAINVVWQVFEKYNPGIASYFIKLMILKGIFIIIFGIIIISVSVYILRRKDRTGWAVLFFLGLAFWVSVLIIEILDKNFYTIAASIVGWIIFVIGMMIPFKYYTISDYDEY
jgi:hypothetical protein